MFVGLFQPLWILIHAVAYNLPKTVLKNQELIDFYNFLQYLVVLLPCPYCVQHALAYLTANAAGLAACKTGEAVFEWTVQFHNDVNHRNGKRLFTLEEARHAIMAHVSGQSITQFANEALLTLESTALRTLENNLLILQNESHRIKEPELLKIEEPHASNATIQYVFDSVFMIVNELDGAKVFNKENGAYFAQFFKLLIQLVPSQLLVQDSQTFLEKYPIPPAFESAQDIWNYVTHWYNAVAGVTYHHTLSIIKDEFTKRLQVSLDRFQKSQKTKDDIQKKHETLKIEYVHAFEQRKLADAGAATLHKQKTNTQTTALIIALTVAIALLVVLLIYHVHVYENTRQKN